MSREEVIGEKYMIAFGVDHATGAYAQLWELPHEDQDCALIRVDSNGVDHIYSLEDGSDPMTPELKRYVDATVKRFEQFSAANPGTRPNISEVDVIHLARIAGGFPDISAQVYKIFGEEL